MISWWAHCCILSVLNRRSTANARRPSGAGPATKRPRKDSNASINASIKLEALPERAPSGGSVPSAPSPPHAPLDTAASTFSVQGYAPTTVAAPEPDAATGGGPRVVKTEPERDFLDLAEALLDDPVVDAGASTGAGTDLGAGMDLGTDLGTGTEKLNNIAPPFFKTAPKSGFEMRFTHSRCWAKHVSNPAYKGFNHI